jgi:hypothetical protein
MLAEVTDDTDERLTNDPEVLEIKAGQPSAPTGSVEPKSTASLLDRKATGSSFRSIYDKP